MSYGWEGNRGSDIAIRYTADLSGLIHLAYGLED